MTGLDVWAAALRQAALHRAVYRFDQVSLVNGDGAALPLTAACFDLAVFSLGVNNFSDPGKVMAECARVLRPGGRLALTTNLSGRMREFFAVFREVLGERGDPAALQRLDRQEAHRGTRASLERLLASEINHFPFVNPSKMTDVLLLSNVVSCVGRSSRPTLWRMRLEDLVRIIRLKSNRPLTTHPVHSGNSPPRFTHH